MSDFRDSQLSSFDYDLPKERIAQAPAEPRHSARLMLVPARHEPFESVRHGHVWDLLDELHAGDLLVVNDTRVLKARLRVRRDGGGLSELLVLEPRGEGQWLCLARPAKRMRPGDDLTVDGTSIRLTVVSEDSASGGRVVQFPADSTKTNPQSNRNKRIDAKGKGGRLCRPSINEGDASTMLGEPAHPPSSKGHGNCGHCSRPVVYPNRRRHP